MTIKKTQKTTIPVIDEKKQQWYLVDVKGKTLGIIATEIANMLRGKQKPLFTPQLDCGDYIVVINARHVRLAGNKDDQKMYQWHSGFPGGFKERTAKAMRIEKPEEIIYDAVWGMLPRNKLRRTIIKKLRIFADETHTHSAQNPKPIEL
ncbi:50S ribosomal protein L13 [Candidatus Gracilibacteria bacterium]|nr:50S ribosomal protein L13 [Candidatus Gracilibacteria bacterium]